ncbi:hypothetical protein yfred0001_1750 [Yersinia frederiksenii ATCC 33641]|nr:hypothetical protein yfred0001_1750 [Yersinia frederiksenii ATCC 33641]
MLHALPDNILAAYFRQGNRRAARGRKPVNNKELLASSHHDPLWLVES